MNLVLLHNSLFNSIHSNMAVVYVASKNSHFHTAAASVIIFFFNQPIFSQLICG